MVYVATHLSILSGTESKKPIEFVHYIFIQFSLVELEHKACVIPMIERYNYPCMYKWMVYDVTSLAKYKSMAVIDLLSIVHSFKDSDWKTSCQWGQEYISPCIDSY